MRAILQRVKSASVVVDGTTISSIGSGLLVLVGISRNDTENDKEYIIRKILNLRLWDDDKGKRWMKSVSAQKFEILCVSQFTLYHVLKGNCPDFHHAMRAEESKDFFDSFVEKLKAAYSPDLVQTGKFGHRMEVNMQGDGPVTITLESPQKKESDKSAGDQVPEGST